MDVLRPQVIWIGNRCYRKNAQKQNPDFNPEDEELYDADPHSDMTYCDEVCDADLDIEETSGGFRLKVPVPRDFYKYIIGKRGDTKRRLETETRTQIFVPKPADKEELIVIKGQEKKGLVSAKTRIDLLVDSARKKLPFTHFLSIPVTSDDILTGFENFKDDVLRDCDGDRGVDGSIFQNGQKLHLTIGTLTLMSKVEEQAAASLLESCQDGLIRSILQDKSLSIDIQGLEIMNDDPSAVDVLYAKVKPGDAANRLQALVDQLVAKFVSSGLMQHEYERVKLHVTVMNTLFRRDQTDAGADSPRAGARQGRPRESFDALAILQKFEHYDFGSLNIRSIHLSERFSTGQDQYYGCLAQARLPES